ncbi:MAG: MGH1-like glycoside hydrolase domain-containing protein, partial [Anaerolineales bacterium]
EWTALHGHSGNLDIVVLMEGEGEVTAETSPFPALTRTLELAPDTPVMIRWVQAARPTPTPLRHATPSPIAQSEPSEGQSKERDGRGESCVELIHSIFEREWEGEFARIELTNAGLLDIETDNREWDAAFAFAQTVALRSYIGPTAHLPHPSFVFTRTPDKGYSRKGDGSDYNWQWNGQVATEAYVNVPQIVSAAPELAKGILRNWLAVQDEKGFVDWKPGLGGQRNKALCVPLLASIAWLIYEYTEDRAFLDEVYPGFNRFFDAWFTPKHDRDEDGVPEWTHTIQSAFDENPSFVRWAVWGQGADITAAEAPDLASYLYREAHSLSRIAQMLGREEDPTLSASAAQLAHAVEEMWRDETASYHYRDRDSHDVTVGEVLAEGQGNLVVDVHRRFKPAARIMVKAIGPKDAKPEMTVTLSGRGQRGRHRVEVLKRSQVQWYFGVATAVSDKVYGELERIEIAGLTEAFAVTVSVVDYTRQDQTLLLPLWAGIPNPARAEALVDKTLLDPDRYWRPYGIPNCSALDPAYQPDNRDGSGGVWMMWNTMLGEGLVEHGYRAEAAELITRLMTGIVHALKTDKAFREAYNADALEGLGERDYIWGVAPVHLFLRVVGIRILTSRRVHLEGHNPFPWPVTVRYKGVTVRKEPGAAYAKVAFPSGREVIVSDEAAQFVDDV